MTEADQYEYVENAPGYGHFSITVHEDGRLSEEQSVPAMKEKDRESDIEYIENQKKRGLPIVVFRNGGKKGCCIAVNEDLIEVEQVNLKVPKFRVNLNESPLVKDFIEETPLTEFYQTIFVPPTSRGKLVSSLEIIAKTKVGLPYRAVVSFVPSRSR